MSCQHCSSDAVFELFIDWGLRLAGGEINNRLACVVGPPLKCCSRNVGDLPMGSASVSWMLCPSLDDRYSDGGSCGFVGVRDNISLISLLVCASAEALCLLNKKARFSRALLPPAIRARILIFH
jgi:hypothetical protein